MDSMENPLLSIITPVYNVEHYLDACLSSLLQQEFTDFELLLINDGSTDRGGTICDQYAARDKRIRVFHQSNHGLSAARNRGLEKAKGKYVAFVDSDDTVSPDLFARNMKILRENPSVDLLEFPIFIYYGSTEERLWRKGPHDFKDLPFNEWFRGKGYDHTYACNKIFRRELFDTIRFPEGKLFEDIYTIPLIVKHSRHYYLSDQGIYYYHAREKSISRTYSFEKYKALFESSYRLWEMANKEEKLAADAEVYALSLADWLVSMGRTDIKQTRALLRHYRLPRLTPLQLLRMPISLHRKIKNLPLALFGERVHCLIYSLLK